MLLFYVIASGRDKQVQSIWCHVKDIYLNFRIGKGYQAFNVGVGSGQCRIVFVCIPTLHQTKTILNLPKSTRNIAQLRLNFEKRLDILNNLFYDLWCCWSNSFTSFRVFCTCWTFLYEFGHNTIYLSRLIFQGEEGYAVVLETLLSCWWIRVVAGRVFNHQSLVSTRRERTLQKLDRKPGIYSRIVKEFSTLDF
jgi:hypothetical protein